MRIPSARRTNGKQPRASAWESKASRLTQAGSNYAACRFGHFGSPEGRKQNSPWASALRLDGVSEAHEALPDTKICGDARPDRKCRAVTASTLDSLSEKARYPFCQAMPRTPSLSRFEDEPLTRPIRSAKAIFFDKEERMWT